MSYYFSKTFSGSFDNAIQKVTEALKTEGFGVLTEIDLKTIIMKSIFMGLLIAVSTLATSTANSTQSSVSIKEFVSSYLQMKNAFTEDNSSGAATAGKNLEAAIKNFDKSALTPGQKKTYEDVEADAREHAEHIGKNGGNIAHQREHFVLLSKDIYDLVKAFGGGQVLYRDFDPMANNGKGAFWLSETKDIKNPYMGKAMLTSGSVKEEIK